MPIVARCDAGTCRRVDLDLKPLHFPAFRGRVLVWATAADGGMQTRPRSVPVTRWRWRRQVSNGSSPLSVTRPVAFYGPAGPQIAVGSSDTATTGNHLLLSGAGLPTTSTWPDWPAPGLAATAFVGDQVLVFAANGADGGLYWQSNVPPRLRPAEGRTLSCSSGDGIATCPTETGKLHRISFAGPEVSTVDSGCPIDPQSGVAIIATRGDNTLISPNAPICVTRFQFVPPYAVVSTTSTSRSYGRAFASLGETDMKVWAAGADGGIWLVERKASLTEALLWDGGIVDGIAIALRQFRGNTTDNWAYWASADRRVHRAGEALPFTAEQAAVALTERVSTTPVLAFDVNSDGGAALFVSRNGAIAAYDADSLERVWNLEPGDAGIRGGRVDTEPIGIEHCGHHGGLLVPSSGDGSLYDFILDGAVFNWRFSRSRWCMAGRMPTNETILIFPFCVAD